MTTGTGKSELSALLGRLIAEQRIELPILPTVALEVMAACEKDETDAAKLSAIIHKDQALAANVLRVANSAAYAGQVPCGSLTQAVGRLGMQLVGEIAVAVAVRGRAFAGKVCAELLAQLWRHAVITGFFCKEIARTRRRNVESAFLCGLLHDIGKAVLLTTVSKHVEGGTVELAEIADALQEHHAAVGGQLARGWRLPPQIVEAIECHHDYDRAKSAQEAAMTVCLADMLAHFVAPAPGVQTVTVDVLRRHPVLLALNLYADQFDALLVRADKAIALAEGMA